MISFSSQVLFCEFRFSNMWLKCLLLYIARGTGPCHSCNYKDIYGSQFEQSLVVAFRMSVFRLDAGQVKS